RSQPAPISTCSSQRIRSTRASASPPASMRLPRIAAAKRLPACWPVPRSRPKPGPLRSVCFARQRRSLCLPLWCAGEGWWPTAVTAWHRPGFACKRLESTRKAHLLTACSSSYSISMAKSAKSKSLPSVADLSKTQARVEHKRLALELEEHDRRYYQDNAPTVSDAEYDALRQRFSAVEKRFPELVTPESPSQKVGAAPSGRFKKVRHALPMLSLDNAFGEDDVIDFVGRIARFLKLADDKIDFSAEPKIDGLSMSLRYERGELVTAATRGDGAEGEDVTANIRTLEDVPKKLKARNVPEICEVRGEVYMTKKAFLALNERQKAAGDTIFANPRNSAAGSHRQKDASIAGWRPLGFFAYAWGEMSGMPEATQTGMIKWFEQCGFKTNPLTKLCHSVEQLLAFHRSIEEQRAELDYDIDGVVYKVDRI